jgi:hypothetical protein
MSIVPVGRENFLKPLGHSGHFKLQSVVASMEALTGIPQCIDVLKIIEKK